MKQSGAEQIWYLVWDKKGVPVADFSYKESTLPTHKLLGSEPLPPSLPDDMILDLRRTTRAKIEAKHVLPTTAGTPLVDELVAQVIRRFAGDAVQFVPVSVRTKDGPVERFRFARPLLELPCADLEKSEIIGWNPDRSRIWRAKLLVFKPDCLGGRHYGRDTYTSRIVVSDELRQALLATGETWLRFHHPEDHEDLINGRRRVLN